MKILRLLVVPACLFGIAACAGSQNAFTPSPLQAGRQSAAQVRPGDTPHALPGDTPHALPGATLGCNLTFATDKANCSVAVNITIPANGNPATPGYLLAGYHPDDLRSRYALPSQSAGGLVAIVDAYDDPLAESDLAIYRSAFGLPSCSSRSGCFRKLNEHGQISGYPIVNTGWDEEISLDLDIVSAVCPNCKILLIEANSASLDDLGTAVNTAASMHPIAISNSYYGPEWSGERSYDKYFYHPGIAITVSAGDQASSFYPADSPYVTSVGGTSLSGSGASWTESAWQYGGQGCSWYEPKPSWQRAATSCATRSTVDVAALADPQTGVTMYDSTAGGFVVVGGTSVGAPLVAAAYALSRNPQGPAYSYAHRSAFHDISPAGYDLATGLGSPNGIRGF